MENVEKIRAKSVIEDKYWILRKNHIKIGQVRKGKDGFEVKINGTITGTFDNLKDLKKSELFEFTELPKIKIEPSMNVYDYPTNEVAYNGVWNVAFGLPLYTQAEDSKSWFAAGFYKVSIKGTWIVQECPKLITLQRNTFKGPFKTNPVTDQFTKMFK